MPQAKVVVPLTGVQLVLGALSVLLGIWADIGALLLVIFLLPTAFVMHAFWKVEDPEAQQMEQLHFLKDLGLAGAALVLFALFASGQGTGMMITAPLLSLG